MCARFVLVSKAVFFSSVFVSLALMLMTLVWRFSKLITDPVMHFVADYMALVACLIVVMVSALIVFFKTISAVAELINQRR